MIKEELEITTINNENTRVFINLAQGYEAEFSNLTHKLPNHMGIYEIDTLPTPPHTGYLLYHKDIPIGFCVTNTESDINDMAEFYIIPVMRRQKLGYQFAVSMFDTHQGAWQVREIGGSIEAIYFWRSVISQYTNNHYEEITLQDDKYGTVTCQRFSTPK